MRSLMSSAKAAQLAWTGQGQARQNLSRPGIDQHVDLIGF
jgi:hypothetical protein